MKSVEACLDFYNLDFFYDSATIFRKAIARKTPITILRQKAKDLDLMI